MSVDVLIPYEPLDALAERLYAYTVGYISARTGWNIRVAGSARDEASRSRFNHPKAINAAARSSTADVLVICDADTLPVGHFEDAVARVESMEWAWSLPLWYMKAGETVTAEILAGADPAATRDEECDWVGDGVSWAGVQIVRRISFLAVGGWDERFVGWGSDDACFGLAMDTIVGEHTRFDGTALHLWHPQGPADSYLHPAWGDQYRLTERYKAAAGDLTAMAAILSEEGSGRWNEASTAG